MVDISVQLSEQKRKVDFKTYDISVKELMSMVNDGIVNISPNYQRKFRWNDQRQSKLIESIFFDEMINLRRKYFNKMYR